MPFTIAIDGPAASGKGTIARALAGHFGFHHLDTGLLYRAVGVRGGDPVQAARDLQPQDLARDDLRTAEAGQAASRVAAIPKVRAALTDFQRRFARREPGAVLDGRDIGTTIAPNADAKIFVTASPETRASRRAIELAGRGEHVDYAAILDDVRKRDARDSERAISPLVAAPDAVTLDTSALDIEGAFRAALAIVEAAKARR